MPEQLPYTHTSIDEGEPQNVAPPLSDVWRRVMRGAHRHASGNGSEALVRGSEVVGALNSAVRAEADRRMGFLQYYKRQVGEVALRQLIEVDPSTGGHRLEPLVLDFARRAHELDRNDDEAGYNLQKGVSSEIAHVVQGGDWDGATALDAAMEELVARETLGEGPERIKRTMRYERSPERARTRMHPLDFSLHEESMMVPYGLIVRNRAYADYGDLRVVRRSSYLASPTLMDEQTRKIHEALLATDDRDHHRVFAAQMLKQFIETHPDIESRRDDPSILPVQTTHFILHRHDTPELKQPDEIQ